MKLVRFFETGKVMRLPDKAAYNVVRDGDAEFVERDKGAWKASRRERRMAKESLGE